MRLFRFKFDYSISNNALDIFNGEFVDVYYFVSKYVQLIVFTRWRHFFQRADEFWDWDTLGVSRIGFIDNCNPSEINRTSFKHAIYRICLSAQDFEEFPQISLENMILLSVAIILDSIHCHKGYITINEYDFNCVTTSDEDTTLAYAKQRTLKVQTLANNVSN